MNRFPPRKKIRLPLPVYHQGHAFFITISTFQKYPWFGKHIRLCENAIKLIRDLSAVNGTNVYAWCIMPDHIHLLIHGNDIIDFVRRFKGKMTPQARSIEAERRLWQRSFFDHALRNEESLAEVSCYIWENPARAAIVDRPENYIWSGSEVWTDWRKYYQ
jgi:putative transposase